MNPYKNLRIAVCNDHAGYDLKLKVIEYLEGEGAIAVKDFGSHSTESCDYADFAHPMASAIKRGEFDFGVSICGSGNGISMTLNKHLGIRAALCSDVFSAKATREHNNANILAMGARVLGAGLALEIVKAFLETPFSNDERHIRRIEQIED